LDGPGGIGKTALAYEIARRCQDRALVEAVIWASAKKEILVVDAPDFAMIPVAAPIMSCDDILNTIGHVLGNRDVTTENCFASKLRIIRDVITPRCCLVIIDSLETLEKEGLREFYAILRELGGPSTFLLTSRPRPTISDWSISLPGMPFDESCELMATSLVASGLRSTRLTEDDQLNLHRFARGNPLTITSVIRLMAGGGFSFNEAISRFEGSPDIITDFAIKPMYDVAAERPAARKALLVMSMFAEYTVSVEDIHQASPLSVAATAEGLARLVKFNLLARVDSSYRVRPLVFLFFRTQGMASSLELSAENVFLAQAYQNLAEHFIRIATGISVDQQLLRFQGDRKWIVLRVLQGLEALAVHSRNIENVCLFKVLELTIELFDLFGFLLGIWFLLDEKIRWARSAVGACRLRGKHRKAAWFEVFDIGWTHLSQGRLDEAESAFSKQRDIARNEGFPEVEALALYNLSRMARNKGKVEDLTTAYRLLETGLGKWPADPRYTIWKAKNMTSLGIVAFKQGYYERARGWMEQALELAEDLRFRALIIEGKSDLALVHAALNDLSRAVTLSGEALDIGRTVPKPSCSYGYALMRRAQIERDFLNQHEKAEDRFKESLRIFESLGTKLMAETVRQELQK